MISLVYEAHQIFFYILSICQSLSFLSFYILLPILTFLLSFTLHSHFFVLFSASYLHSPAHAFHTNSSTCNPPKHPLSFPTHSHLHAPIHSQKSPHHIFFPLHIRQTWLNFLHAKKSSRAIATGAALLQELTFQKPIPEINTRTLFLFWYPSILELFQYLIIFFQLPRGHLRRHFISILKYFTILHYD